jgi:hypothetical protein
VSSTKELEVPAELNVSIRRVRKEELMGEDVETGDVARH